MTKTQKTVKTNGNLAQRLITEYRINFQDCFTAFPETAQEFEEFLTLAMSQVEKETEKRFHEKYNNRQRKYIAKNIEAGKCTMCSFPASTVNKRLCEYHREMRIGYVRKWRKNR